MSDWKDWDKLLGPGGGEVESSGGSSEKNAKGHEGTIVIRRRTGKKGPAIFEVFMQAKPPGFAPTNAVVVSLEVEGFDGAGCTGTKKCAKFAFLPANAGLLKPVAGGKLAFEPAANDGGVLSGLLAQCDCGTQGVKSYKIYVTVEFTPPQPGDQVRFSICYPCGVIEEIEA